jgi:hypothetical protein
MVPGLQAEILTRNVTIQSRSATLEEHCKLCIFEDWTFVLRAVRTDMRSVSALCKTKAETEITI